MNMPTTDDLRKLAFDLSKHYAQMNGLTPMPTPMKVLIDGNITVKELEQRLKLAGLEMYPDATGANFIRTIEAGNLHRELLKAQRDVERIEREYRTEIVGYSSIDRMPITREVPIPDGDEEHDADVQRELNEQP